MDALQEGPGTAPEQVFPRERLSTELGLQHPHQRVSNENHSALR